MSRIRISSQVQSTSSITSTKSLSESVGMSTSSGDLHLQKALKKAEEDRISESEDEKAKEDEVEHTHELSYSISLSRSLGSEACMSEGGRKKREILLDLMFISRRLEAHMKIWKDANWTYKSNVEGNVNEAIFPKGFGFFLMNCHLISDDNENIQELQKLVTHIPSVEIQDGLLSFLDDYEKQSNYTRDFKADRKDNLQSVADWMEVDGENLASITGVGIGAVREAHALWGSYHARSWGRMDKLSTLRKQMKLLKRSKSQGQRQQRYGSMSEVQLSSEGSETHLSTNSSQLSLASQSGQASGQPDPLDSLLKIVQGTRNVSNEGIMDGIEAKIREITNVMSTRGESMKRLIANLKEKRTEREKLEMDLDDAKEENAKLSETIKGFRERKQSRMMQEARMRKIGVKMSTIETKNVSCQVAMKWSEGGEDSIQKETKKEEEKARPQPAPTMPAKSLTASDKPSGGSTPKEQIKESGEKRKQPSVIQVRAKEVEQPAPPLAAPDEPSDHKDVPVEPSTEQEGLKKDEGEELLGVGVGEELTAPSNSTEIEKSSEEIDVTDIMEVRKALKSKKDLRGESQSSRPSSLKGSRRGSLRWKDQQSVDSVKLLLKKGQSMAGRHGAVEIPPYPPYVVLRMTPERLRELLGTHIDNMLIIVKPLRNQLLVLRKNARTEIQRIKSREETMTRIEKLTTNFLNITPVDRENLPTIDYRVHKKNAHIYQRAPESHKCWLCMCHKTTTESIETNDLKDPNVQQHTLAACGEYMGLLNGMRQTYKEVCTNVASARRVVRNLLAQLVWGELGTSDYSDMDEEQDKEISDRVKQALKIPSSLPKLQKHAIYVTDLVKQLVKDIAVILRHSRIRVADIKAQNEMVREVKSEMADARTSLEETALQMTRIRAGSNFLRSSQLLNMSKCACCRCYNSALEDGSRTLPTEDAHERDVMFVTRTMGLLQQAMGSVIRTTSSKNNVVSEVTPDTMKELRDTQVKLLQALHVMVRESPSVSAHTPAASGLTPAASRHSSAASDHRN